MAERRPSGRAARGNGRGPAVVLAVGGLDPSGGAGVLADARAIALAGAWPAAVCASLTVQSTRGLVAVQAVARAFVAAQLDELFADLPIDVVKTGALGSAANARLLAALARARPELRLVVDPVLGATRARGGAATLNVASGRALEALCAAAALVTPNVPEAERLLGAPIGDAAGAERAARALARRWGTAVLLKGGHLPGRGPVRDFLAAGGAVTALAHPRHRTPPLHGTGCTLAALVAGRLATRGPRGRATLDEWARLVRWAQGRMDRLLGAPLTLGRGLSVLGPRLAPRA
ncbi:MAG: bifunctional hydroxymethylpyrimidine kinase/phosphomethylpyrimidine kinase [Polyangiaceae bacterium]|nr:bifunctional hydroxymethylpyrimidine kinase/phosphomethylpyrimidine kinase [Polyangiaceae bacterium]